MSRSQYGGRHELGQNFLHHKPTINRMISLVGQTSGPILELGAGDGALTRPLSLLDRELTALEIDEHRVRRLRRRFPDITIAQGDALTYSFSEPVVVGNVPFHLTTPILRRLLDDLSWEDAILLTQWEVARKRAGVGGSTMMTAQSAPWFTFGLEGRVPSWGFTPQPSVDAAILVVHRRHAPLLEERDRGSYERFVRSAFTSRGRTLAEIIQNAGRTSNKKARSAIQMTEIKGKRLPRDLDARQWVALWKAVR